MGKNGKLGKTYKSAPPKAKPSNKAASSSIDKAPTKMEPTVPKDLQQRCLNVFRDALWTGAEDVAALQEVKGHLYNRDFAKAFGSDHYLRAYALRWSAARSLGYLQIFNDLQEEILDSREVGIHATRIRVLGLGGGAGAELVALAGCFKLLHTEREAEMGTVISGNVELVDIARWDPVVQALEDAIVKPPVLSKYASAAAREANVAMVPEGISMSCTQADVLNWDEGTVVEKAGKAEVVTLMFTLNELYSTSVPKTQQLLAFLTAAMPPGALLLVVDSPGSYSTVSIAGAEKKYPMQWLLDHTLLGKTGTDDEKKDWDKLLSDDSKWFRLPEELAYPIELENMRYQIHLYRRRERNPSR